MKKLFSLAVCVCMLATLLAAPAMADGMTPGVYTGTAKGMFDGLTVNVTVSETTIEKIEVVSHNETSPGWAALEKLPEAIVEAQSIAVDSISGATMSSIGVKAAVEAALMEAGADIAAFSQPVEAKPEAAVSYNPVMGSFEVLQTWDETYDVVIVGGGFAGMAAAYASGEAGASTVLVEKLSNTGGNSAINGGQYASYTSSRAAEL